VDLAPARKVDESKPADAQHVVGAAPVEGDGGSGRASCAGVTGEWARQWVDPLRFMLDTSNMAARPVQISIDPKLLEQIDRDPQTKKQGRSAFIRDAVRLYLEAKRRHEIDARIERAFGGHRDELLDDVEGMLEGQAWPEP
jgi:Arc/MetJ-type ribon-helix-helix transcriptional regulator